MAEETLAMGTRYFKNDIVVADGEFWRVTRVADKSSDSPTYHLTRFSDIYDEKDKEQSFEAKASDLEKLKPKGGWLQSRRFTKGQNRKSRNNPSPAHSSTTIASFKRKYSDFMGDAYLSLERNFEGATDVIYHKPSTKGGHDRNRIEIGMSPKLALQVALRFMDANDNGRKTFSVDKDNSDQYEFDELIENDLRAEK